MGHTRTSFWPHCPRKRACRTAPSSTAIGPPSGIAPHVMEKALGQAVGTLPLIPY
jgi:hypothetical protein